MQDIISVAPKRRTVIITHWNSDISISIKKTNILSKYLGESTRLNPDSFLLDHR